MARRKVESCYSCEESILKTALSEAKNFASEAFDAMDNQERSYEYGCTSTPQAKKTVRYYMGEDAIHNSDYRGLLTENFSPLLSIE